jgi:hypothetical protein
MVDFELETYVTYVCMTVSEQQEIQDWYDNLTPEELAALDEDFE